MNVAEARALLSMVIALDQRMTSNTDEAGEFRVRAWAEMLDTVPARFAAECVTRHYRNDTREHSIRPGDIRATWVAAQQKIEQAQPFRRAQPGSSRPLPDARRAELLTMVDRYPNPHGGVAEHVRDMIRTGWVWEPTYAENAADRHCGIPACPCPHQGCSDGWADNDEGPMARCPSCEAHLQRVRPPKEVR